MGYPCIEVCLPKLRENAAYIQQAAQKAGCAVSIVVKALCADQEVVSMLDTMGFAHLADSRVQNLQKMAFCQTPRMLLRIPMKSEIEAVLETAHVSLVSEIQTLNWLDAAARRLRKTHGVVLMADLGDLREGFFDPQELLDAARLVKRCEGLTLEGVGVNLTCYGAVIPTKEILETLSHIASAVQRETGSPLSILSGGNSSSLPLLLQGDLPLAVNHLRIGEAFLLGRETAYGNFVPGLHKDAFCLRAQIVEVKTKPSVPRGEIGMDAFGNRPVYEDKGWRKRAILAIGQQDTDSGGLYPQDLAVQILGASSDHLLVDITESSQDYGVGDLLSFHLGYGALLKGFTSPYVYKTYQR